MDENFIVDFGEVTRVTTEDFNKLINRPSYAGGLMTGDTDIPQVPSSVSELNNDSNYQTGVQVSEAIETEKEAREAADTALDGRLTTVEGIAATISNLQTAVDGKQDKLIAGANINIAADGKTISATDTTYTAGNAIDITNGEISADIHPADFFTASDSISDCGSNLSLDNTIATKLKSVELKGDTFQQTAPSPDYPQPVNVVTGGQTIELGSSPTSYQPYTSQSYPISLGSIELCKIGDYQDYIYKGADGWYLHKETGKAIFNGTEEGWSNDTSGSYLRVFHSLENVLSAAGRVADGYSNYFIPSATDAYGIYLRNQNHVYFYPQSSITTLADFKTWLSTHNTNLYYPLATTTDTKITDATLVAQLNALAEAKSYNNQTNIVVAATGENLPATLCVEAYRKSLNGLLGVIERLGE